MKKLLLTVAIATIGIGAYAQVSTPNLVSKKGIKILPEKGEYSIGISAEPILNFAGDVMAGASGNQAFTFANNLYLRPAIFGKYMLSDNSAVRARFQFDMTNNSAVNVVAKSSTSPDINNPEFVDDITNVRTSNILLGLGYEKRRGSSRIQGVYGAEAVIGYSNIIVNYDYGNDINANFNTPAIANPGNYDGFMRRLIEDKPGRSFMGGVRGFIGIEFFLAPKISLGGEFGYSILANYSSNRTQVREYWDSGSSSVKEVSIESTNAGTRGITAGVDNLNAAFNMFFYF